MRLKAIKDLSQLKEKDFFCSVSKGISYIYKNSKSLFLDAKILYESDRQRGNSVLQSIANEEVAKILILLDAVRCPRKLSEEFSRQLGLFNNHLAKGIYWEACYWSMTTFGELIEAVDAERELYYLDGPNDFDWIFRNRILSEREETLYVDYYEIEKEHIWHIPRENKFLNNPVSCALNLCESIIEMGLVKPESLKIMSDFWEQIKMTASFQWSDLRDLNLQMIKILERKKLLQEVNNNKIRIYLDCWQFPMYLLDFNLSKEDNRKKLREIQRNWHP